MSFLQVYNKIKKQGSPQPSTSDVSLFTAFNNKIPVHSYFNMTGDNFNNLPAELKETFMKNYFESIFFGLIFFLINFFY